MKCNNLINWIRNRSQQVCTMKEINIHQHNGKYPRVHLPLIYEKSKHHKYHIWLPFQDTFENKFSPVVRIICSIEYNSTSLHFTLYWLTTSNMNSILRGELLSVKQCQDQGPVFSWSERRTCFPCTLGYGNWKATVIRKVVQKTDFDLLICNIR